MDSRFSRRGLILAACLGGFIWAAPAQAQAISLSVPMSGGQSVPPVETGATGTAKLTYNPATRVVTWDISYMGLSSPATMAHFHGPAQPGKNGPVVIWLTKQGTPPENPIKGEATLTPEQAQQFAAGEWYINLHTQSHPAGELRGQVVPPKG
jgi:hypothetical protein